MKQGEFMRDRGLDALCKCPLAGVILVVCLVMASLTVSASGNGSAGDVCGAAGDYDEVFVSVEKMPLFPGGEAALMTYIRDNITYPATAADKNIQGKVVVQFVVDTAGQVGDVKVLRSVDADLDREAVRVVQTLPKFIPGTRLGKPVNVWYTLPVNFKLNNDISDLLSYIHEVDSIAIDYSDLNLTAPAAITPANYDAGQLSQSGNKLLIKKKWQIRNMVNALGSLAKLSQGRRDTRGKITLYFKDDQKRVAYIDRFSL